MRLVSKAICTEAEPVSSGDVLNSATSFKDGREFWSLATILTTRDWRPEEDEARTVVCETEETNGWVVSGFEVLERQNARDVSKARKERHSRPIERASRPENARKKTSTARLIDDRFHPPFFSSSTIVTLRARLQKARERKHRPGTQKKKERERPECAPEEEDTCAVPLAKLLPVAENMFFRAFDAVET